MRNRVSAVVLVVALIGMGIGSMARAQTPDAGIRTFNPVVVPIEIDGTEPPPPGVDATLDFSGQGGFPEIDTLPPEPHFVTSPVSPAAAQPHWSGLNIFQEINAAQVGAEACGLNSGQPAVATLTLPDGHHVTRTTNKGKTPGCFTAPIVEWQIGMELGIYSLSVSDGVSTLTHQIAVEYPTCPDLFGWNAGGYKPRSESHMFLGFTPKQNVTVRFYSPSKDKTDKWHYAASRTVQVDDQGTALVTVTLGRSAAFDQVMLLPDSTGAPVQAVPAATYSTYTVKGYVCGGNPGRYVQVAPQDATPLTLYDQPDTGSTRVGALQVGEPVEVLDQQPVVENDRVVSWLHLQNSDGLFGWAKGVSMIDIVPKLVEGGSAKFVKVVGDKQYDIGLWKDISSIDVSNLVSRPADGSRVTLVSFLSIPPANSQLLANEWWYVRAEDGTLGWVPQVLNNWYPQYFLDPLPWKPVSVSGIDVPNMVTQVASCPNSPRPRLTIGQKARITPGDPNALVDTPNGQIIGKIPGGSAFAVLDGPQCGRQGRAYWKLTYNGQTGWTAEGEGNQYWVEPLK